MADARNDTPALGSSGGGRPEGARIPSSLSPISAPGTFTTGEFPGAGTYFCVECGSQLSIQEDDRLPSCPRCENESFRLDSIFESMQEHSATTAEFAAPAEPETVAWLEQHRASLAPGSRHLVCRLDDGETIDFEIERGWTRIGRSVAADLRLDDPSVSRRHALVVSEPGEPLRVLDDRSLNGVLVNGEPIEWARLEDGDELTIGSFRLYTLEA
jgi:hypothetical protein